MPVASWSMAWRGGSCRWRGSRWSARWGARRWGARSAGCRGRRRGRGRRLGGSGRRRGLGLAHRRRRNRPGPVGRRRDPVAVGHAPAQNGLQVRVGVVVGQDRPSQVGRNAQVTSVAAQVDTRRRRRVEHVVRVGNPVPVSVAGVGLPGARKELHRADGTVVCRVAVQRAAVGVPDHRGTGQAAVQAGSEDEPTSRAGLIDAAAPGVAGLDTADAGQDPPRQVAGRHTRREVGLGLAVRREHRDGYAGLAGRHEGDRGRLGRLGAPTQQPRPRPRGRRRGAARSPCRSAGPGRSAGPAPASRCPRRATASRRPPPAAGRLAVRRRRVAASSIRPSSAPWTPAVRPFADRVLLPTLTTVTLRGRPVSGLSGSLGHLSMTQGITSPKAPTFPLLTVGTPHSSGLGVASDRWAPSLG